MTLTLCSILFFLLLLIRCSDADSINKKDLDENMIDMMVYHDNLGMYLRTGDAENAGWLLEGMDSSLQVIASKFTTHRKLTAPFRKDYEKKLVPPINDIRKALGQKDFATAIQAYRTLTKNCNGCHIDLEIDKDVIDWSDPAIH